ncbi:MAG: hypothetical protein AB8E74_07295 [Prochlorococcus sp.]
MRMESQLLSEMTEEQMTLHYFEKFKEEITNLIEQICPELLDNEYDDLELPNDQKIMLTKIYLWTVSAG